VENTKEKPIGIVRGTVHVEGYGCPMIVTSIDKDGAIEGFCPHCSKLNAEPNEYEK